MLALTMKRWLVHMVVPPSVVRLHGADRSALAPNRRRTGAWRRTAPNGAERLRRTELAPNRRRTLAPNEGWRRTNYFHSVLHSGLGCRLSSLPCGKPVAVIGSWRRTIGAERASSLPSGTNSYAPHAHHMPTGGDVAIASSGSIDSWHVIAGVIRRLLNGGCASGTASSKAHCALCVHNVDLRPPEENQLGT